MKDGLYKVSIQKSTRKFLLQITTTGSYTTIRYGDPISLEGPCV